MRSCVRRILVFLLLGAIVNVAVAWGCAIGHGDVEAGPFTIYRREGNRNPRLVHIHSRFGYRIVMDDDIDAPMYAVLAHLIEPDVQPTPYKGMIWWPQEKTWEGGHIAVGWPAPALCATLTHEWGPIDEPGGRRVHASLRHGVPVGHEPLPDFLFDQTIPMFLPYRPVWSGLIGNTLLYGVAAAAIASGVRALKRFARIRRGLCPACAYPRGSSPVCTECGAPLAVANLPPRGGR